MRAPKPACMTVEEFDRWTAMNEGTLGRAKADTPCRDCSLAWHLGRVMLGECDGTPLGVGQRRRMSDDDRVMANRRRWREYRARKRAIA